WLRGEVATRYFKGHQDNIYCLAWVGPNKVASGSRDRAICIWDLQTGQCTRFDSGHTGSVLCMRASRDYSILLTGSSDATCKIWSLPDCRLLLTFRGHGHGVLDVCVIQDYIVTSSRDHTIRVWDKTGRELRQLTGHTGSVNALEPLDDRRVISASGDSTLKVWDITTGQCLRTMKGHTYGLACVRYDGERIYSGGQDSQIRVWDPETGECLMTMSGHMNLIRTMDCFDGKLVSGSYDRTLRVWDTKTGACLLSFQSGHSSWIFNVLLSRTKIVSAGQDRRIMMLDFAQGIQTAKLFKEIL
ncbi:WD40-repeat-containing domain protein, partial [Radiomyces spectabilis]|uniref:WD40-repeat-containing domain protein n=1 Tax=Radiomyces spectabilis TaxID=64574 RepID=UPI00221EDF4F